MKEIASSADIKKFRQKDYIYIDKTEYIYNLITKYERVFFSRPRRFGKSLTLNTIETLFEKGVDPYFQGTWIHDRWKQNKYPVLHLNFLEYSTTDLTEFKRQFCLSVSKFARKQKIDDVLEDKEPNVYISNLFDAMSDDQQLVLLIDEYDCQLTANIGNPELYKKFRNFLRDFYATIKGAYQIQFMAVTGVTRLKDVSIFSVGSDIKDLTYEHSFSQMIGFTRDEIKRYYIDYLKRGVSYEQRKAAELVTDDEVESFIDRIEVHYDGYCFDNKNRKKVFSTYSVNSFFQTMASDEEVVFGNYWYDVGGLPSVLINYMGSYSLDIEKLLLSEIQIPYNDLMNPVSLLEINENVLMCQTGYLTLKSPLDISNDVLLGPANMEVRRALFSLLSLRIFKTNISPYNANSKYVLEQGNADEIIALFNSLLAALAYDKYPVTSESVLRALLQAYLVGKNHDVRVEQHNSKGRSDILVNFPERRVVLELKYTTSQNEVSQKLNEAETQIRERGYGQELLGGRELLQIACVFNGAPDQRRIAAYRTINLDCSDDSKGRI